MAFVSPLRDSHGSLSKYITLESHFDLLRQIKSDTPVSDLVPKIDDGVLTTAIKRYLLVENNIIRRDRLIDLTHEEGSLTDRIRMIMYFLFMLRDSRYRSFICSEIADRDGLWHDDVFRNQTKTYFDGAGGQKAFTNLRQMLVHGHLLTDTFRLRPFPPLESWFSDGVEVAAQHISDRAKRRMFMENPKSVLFQSGIHGLLNATSEQLVETQGGVLIDEAVDLLPSYEELKGRSTAVPLNLTSWVERSPAKIADKLLLSTTDPVLLERAHFQHHLLEKMMAETCAKSGRAAKKSQLIDLVVSGTQNILFEMKSCSISSLRSQVRRGISQLFEYSYLFRQELTNPTLCLVLERKPRGNTEWLIDYLGSLGILLIWKKDKAEQFECPAGVKAKLIPILSGVAEWD